MKPELLAIGITAMGVITTLLGVLIGKIIYSSKLDKTEEEYEIQFEKMQDNHEKKIAIYENTIKDFQRKNVELKDRVKLLEIQLSEKNKMVLELERDMSKELTADLIKTVIDSIKKQ